MEVNDVQHAPVEGSAGWVFAVQTQTFSAVPEVSKASLKKVYDIKTNDTIATKIPRPLEPLT